MLLGLVGCARSCEAYARPTNGRLPRHVRSTCRHPQLDDGHVFVDSHTKTNKSGELEITLGMRQMFGTGGDLGIASMRVGERAMITCHSEFACGAAGQGEAIPPNSRLTFDVSLVKNREDTRVLRETLWGMFYLFCFLIFVFGALYKTGNIWHGGKHVADYRIGHGPMHTVL